MASAFNDYRDSDDDDDSDDPKDPEVQDPKHAGAGATGRAGGDALGGRGDVRGRSRGQGDDRGRGRGRGRDSGYAAPLPQPDFASATSLISEARARLLSTLREDTRKMSAVKLDDAIARCEESKMFFGMARGESSRAAQAAPSLVSRIAHGLVSAQCRVYIGDAYMRISLLRINRESYLDTMKMFFAPALDCAKEGRQESDFALAQIVGAEESGLPFGREARARAEDEIEQISKAISIMMKDVREQIRLLTAKHDKLRNMLENSEIARDVVKNSMGPERWASQRGNSDYAVDRSQWRRSLREIKNFLTAILEHNEVINQLAGRDGDD